VIRGFEPGRMAIVCVLHIQKRISGMNKSSIDQLTNRQLQLVLTYAPAGLGHLRIMHALYHGLPETVNPVILGSQDKSIQTMHRIMSIQPIGSEFFEWLETGPISSPANSLYRSFLRWNTDVVYNEMSRLIDERFEPLQELLVVCTHFGLAHKLAAIKDKLQKEKQVRMVLVVFIPDDTFQHILYIDGADLLVVTSEYIKKKYAAYGRSLGKSERIEVVPYPLNLHLGKKLSTRQMAEKTHQLDAKSREPIRISIPIPGAAVGTGYFSKLMACLREKSDRFHFYIVSKDAPFTKFFLSKLAGKPWIDLRLGKQDREVVDLYDHLLDEQVFSLEVTKPSEQAFKALLGTQTRGGVILLFSEPVGSQEYDNLDFLVRHFLVPSKETNAELWEMAGNNASIDPTLRTRLLEESRTWRGVRIPNDPQQAADLIRWMLTSGMFTRMLEGNKVLKVRDENSGILGSNGVAEFWDLAASI
jgi:hypothetical protein